MRTGAHRHHLRLITEISVTPLLDLVFVLLFVFMLAAPLLRNDAVLDLPVSRTASTPAPAEVVILSIDREHRLQLDGQDLAPEHLQASLAALAAARPSAGVMVQIHRGLPVQDLVDVMDALRSAGVARTAVVTSHGVAP